MKLFQLELTNHCNANCSFCNHSVMKREKGFASMGTVEKAIRLIKGEQQWICLMHYGESLLHPKFFEIVELFHEAGMKGEVYTNGKLLTSDMIEKIERSNLAQIVVSMNRFNPEKEVRELVEHGGNTSVLLTHLRTPGGFDTKDDALTNDDIPRVVEFSYEVGVPLRVGKYYNPERVNGKYGCEYKFKDGTCKLRKHNQVICLWDETLTGCLKDYDAQNPIGVLDDLPNLKYKNTKCLY